jgi:hypothetical protein
MQSFASVPSFETHRKIIKYNFETLLDVSGIPRPKFVFAHIISPHPPFVFDRAGNPVELTPGFSFADASDYPGTRESYQENYIEQVIYVNHNLQNVIESILSTSDVPPIIILQADHGSGMLANFSNYEDMCLKERFSSFSAYYLPGVDASAIPSIITNVNTFRIVFNEFFQANYPLLPNIHYAFKDANVYDPINVTSEVNTCN